MAVKDNKIYCYECKYFSEDAQVTYNGYCYNWCMKPSAVIGKEVKPATAIYPEIKVDVLDDSGPHTCQILNENNDCKYFKKGRT